MTLEDEDKMIARVLRLEIEAHRDREMMRQHLDASDKERAEGREEQRLGRAKSEKEREEIKGMIQANTRAINNANLAGKILVRVALVVAGVPAAAFAAIKGLQEILDFIHTFFPPRTPIHACVVYAAAAALIFTAAPGL